MSSAFRDEDYLDHIRQAVDKIFRYTQGVDEAGFLGNELVQDGVIRNLEIIGEAVTKLSPELKGRHPAIPWADIAGMRNRLIHGYISVDLAIVWDTVQRLVPDLLNQVVGIQRDLGIR